MSSTEILSLVEQYKEAQQLIEAAQAEMDDLKRQITEEMTRRDVDTMDAGTHKVRYQTVTSSRLDSKGLKPASPRPPRAAASLSPERMVCNGTT